jgi:hypothetical protein
MLARKVCDSIIVFALKINKLANEFMKSGKLSSILNCPELTLVTDHLMQNLRRFHQYKKSLAKQKLNIFSIVMLEVLSILRKTHQEAIKSDPHLPPLPNMHILDAFDLIKLICDDNKNSFATINMIHETVQNSKEPEWTQVDSTQDWTHLDLSANFETELELSIDDPTQ